MKWLVTVRATGDLNRVARELRRRGCAVGPVPSAVAMTEGERVLQCEGPPNLPETARDIPGVVRINPSSDLTLF